MGFLLIGIDSLIACIAVGPIIRRRWPVPFAVLFGICDGGGFLLGTAFHWSMPDSVSNLTEVVALGVLGLYWIGIALFSRQAARADGTASFVGIERVTGSVGGRTGTFLLQDQGTVTGGVVEGEWFVVPGSGTGELPGLRGTGGFRANLGENATVNLTYWFE